MPTPDNSIPNDIHVHVDQEGSNTEYHRLREAREESRYQDLMKQPLNLSVAQKMMMLILSIVMAVVSVAGTYLVFKATTDLRLSDVEKRVDKNVTIIEHMSQFGFGGHETRISRLEVRADTQQQAISDVKAKLDTAVAILERIEVQINKQGK